MKVSYDYDQDPRYGWVSIDIEDSKDPLIIIHDESGSHGFTYNDGEMTPTCICAAWAESECSCGLY